MFDNITGSNAAERFASFLEEHDGNFYEMNVDRTQLADKPWLLVEKSRHEPAHGDLFVTHFGSPEDAFDYHDGQEYPEDWPIVGLVNLDTGHVYDATQLVTTTTVVTSAANGRLSDAEALDKLNLLLSASEWPGASGMEDVCEIVRATGRSEIPDAPEWARH